MNKCSSEALVRLFWGMLALVVMFACSPKGEYSFDIENDVYISADTLSLNNDNYEAYITIQNNVSKDVKLSIQFDNELISSSEETLRLEGFAAATLKFTFLKDAFTGDSITSVVKFMYDQTQELEVILNYHNFGFDQELFDFSVADVQYCSYDESIIFLSKGADNKVYKYETKTRTWQSFTLASSPVCMSVSPSRSYVAVALSDKRIHLIDLKSMTLARAYTIQDDCFAIALSSARWIYAFTKGVSPQNDYYSIDTNTETIYPEKLIHGLSNLVVKLHPDEQSIYGLLEWWSSSNVTYKFELENNRIVSHVDNAHTYDFSHHFWYASNGKYLIGKTGKYFSRTDESYDFLQYEGQLSGLRHGILSVAHNTVSDHLYVANEYKEDWSDEDFKSLLLCYDMTSLQAPEELALPPFRSEANGLVQAMPRYVFMSSDNKRLFVVASPMQGEGIDEWSIIFLNQ